MKIASAEQIFLQKIPRTGKKQERLFSPGFPEPATCTAGIHPPMGGAEPNHESFFGLELHFHASAAEVDFPAVNLPVKLLIGKRTDSSEIPLRGSKCFFIIPNIRNKNISTNTIDMLTQISSNPAKDNIRFATEKILFISMIKAFITIDLGRKFSNQINCSASISNPGN